MTKKELKQKTFKIWLGRNKVLSEKVQTALFKLGIIWAGGLGKNLHDFTGTEDLQMIMSDGDGLIMYSSRINDFQDFQDSHQKYEVISAQNILDLAGMGSSKPSQLSIFKSANWKVWVGDDEQLSKDLQDKLFSLGFEWLTSGKSYHARTGFSNMKSIYIVENGTLDWNAGLRDYQAFENTMKGYLVVTPDYIFSLSESGTIPLRTVEEIIQAIKDNIEHGDMELKSEVFPDHKFDPKDATHVTWVRKDNGRTIEMLEIEAKIYPASESDLRFLEKHFKSKPIKVGDNSKKIEVGDTVQIVNQGYNFPNTTEPSSLYESLKKYKNTRVIQSNKQIEVIISRGMFPSKNGDRYLVLAEEDGLERHGRVFLLEDKSGENAIVIGESGLLLVEKGATDKKESIASSDVQSKVFKILNSNKKNRIEQIDTLFKENAVFEEFNQNFGDDAYLLLDEIMDLLKAEEKKQVKKTPTKKKKKESVVTKTTKKEEVRVTKEIETIDELDSFLDEFDI